VEGSAAIDVPLAFPTAASHPATVLLVEDEPMVRTVASHALADAGLTVIEAANGEQALERARAHEGPIDLLVTDVVMARMGGPELARSLKGDRPEVRVLFVSGYSREVEVPPADIVAGIDFLEKPFTPKSLVDRVSRLLAAGPRPPTDEGVAAEPGGRSRSTAR